MRSFLRFVAIPIALLACTGIAGAQEAARLPRPGLNWVRLPGGEGCIAAQELAQRVEARAGRVLFTTASDAEIFLTGSIAPVQGGGFRALLQVTDAAGAVFGERELSSAVEDCRALDEAIVVVIAVTLYPRSDLVGAGIALDPAVAQRLEEIFRDEPSELDPAALPVTAVPVAAPAAAPAADPAPAPAPVSEPAQEPAPRRWQLGLDASGVIAYGRVPKVGLGIAPRLFLRAPARWSLELAFHYFPGSSVDADTADSSVRVGLWTLGLVGCAPPVGMLGDMALCLGAEGGRTHAEPHGFSNGQQGRSDATASLMVGAHWRLELLPHFHARLGATVGIPLVFRSYSYENTAAEFVTIYETKRFFLQAEAGLGASF